MAVPVSILILTQDEESNLPKCLESLQWCKDIVVIDSGSTDRSVEIAREAGCRILQRPFDDFATQRNHGLEFGEFKHNWILHLDADEVMRVALQEEISAVLQDPHYDAYRIPSKTMFMDQWLKYSGMYPVYQVRLTRLGVFQFKQVGHGQKADIDPSRIGTLQQPYLHYSFSKGLDDWYKKHQRYAVAEAHETLKQLSGGTINWAGMISADATLRRRSLKHLSCRLPFRPALRFIYMYLLRCGFLDGIAGYKYCRMLRDYERMIVRKVHEMERRDT